MKNRSYQLIFFPCSPSFLPLTSLAGTPFIAKITGITDGDTSKVLNKQNESVKIRLAEINTTERKQLWSNKAKHALSDLTFQKKVTVQC